MNRLFKSAKALPLVIVLTAFSCSSDDEESVANIPVNIQNLTVTIDENPADGQVVGIIETDRSGNLNFSITSQTPTGALSINSSTGEVTVANGALFDFETNQAITATVTVDDAQNPATITVNLNDLDEISTQDLTVAIDENPTDGQVVGAIQVTGAGTLTFSITSQTPAGALNMDSSTGELTVTDPNLFDFETNPVITANIEVDNTLYTVTAIATINLNDVDEITVQELTTSIDENPSNGDTIGTLPATGGSLTFTITFQNPAGAFNIDQNTGELSVADETLFDFETNPNMLATILVDNGISSVSANAFVGIDNVNEIGDLNYGGIIFWIDPTSNNSEGLVCAVTDQPSGIPWKNGSNSNTGAVGTTIGTGQANTTAIVNNQGVGSYAAQLCNDLSLNGYDDWFLPSIDELQEMYNNKDVINAAALANSGTSFEEGVRYYWSSTQVTNSQAFVLKFTDNLIQSGFKSSTINALRAVRAWTDF